MPPKAKFTKEEIVDAALRLARRAGIGAVTARDVAAELGVSTRPIFTYFDTMDELKEAVILAGQDIYRSFVSAGLQAPIPFLGVGQQYIRFAQEEPMLYRMLFLAQNRQQQDGFVTLLDRVRPGVMAIYHMDEAAATRYIRDMWLVTNSVATMVVNGSCPYDDADIVRIMTGFSLALCKTIKEVPGFVSNDFDRDSVFRSVIGL